MLSICVSHSHRIHRCLAHRRFNLAITMNGWRLCNWPIYVSRMDWSFVRNVSANTFLTASRDWTVTVLPFPWWLLPSSLPVPCNCSNRVRSKHNGLHTSLRVSPRILPRSHTFIYYPKYFLLRLHIDRFSQAQASSSAHAPFSIHHHLFRRWLAD